MSIGSYKGIAAVRAYMDAVRLAGQLGRVRFAPRDQVTPSSLPTGNTMAERRMIAMLPDEIEAYLERQVRQTDLPSAAQVAFAREILENLTSPTEGDLNRTSPRMLDIIHGAGLYFGHTIDK